jgi:hypothetical protein
MPTVAQTTGNGCAWSPVFHPTAYSDCRTTSAEAAGVPCCGWCVICRKEGWAAPSKQYGGWTADSNNFVVRTPFHSGSLEWCLGGAALMRVSTHRFWQYNATTKVAYNKGLGRKELY